MNLTMTYFGRSELLNGGARQTLRFAPNLSRDPVAFDGGLRHPLRFREAISALHDVVISDLRFKARNKTAYEEWKKQEQERLATLRRAELKRAKEEILRKHADVPPDLEKEFERCRRRYWDARLKYSTYLQKNDPQLWRLLMPCDPVITVDGDVVFFECFSADESSYGCLTVDREDGFEPSTDMRPGTTNVDYSWQLYDHFQSLRSYRETRLRVDPSGFDVATRDAGKCREEKIDLPAGWVRGFMQIQGAMGLPMKRVSLSREAVYSVLAWLKRHRARTSPRAMRFELLPDKPPALVLEPWEQRIVSLGTTYQGPPGEPIRIWGTRRLLTLGRLLPLAERFDVYLLGTGFPSFWVARMGEMRLTLGLSGWTTNDWTRGSALDLLAPPAEPSRDLVTRLAGWLRAERKVPFAEIEARMAAAPATCAAALNHLAHAGQVIYDLAAGVYRWRQVMPMAVGEAEIGPENAELVASRTIVERRQVSIESQQEAPRGAMVYTGKAEGKPVELLIDGDGMIRRGKCLCGHHRRAGIRMGPCRHLLALRHAALRGNEASDTSTAQWYNRLRRWSAN
jgi:hypothetical protein